MNRNPIIPFLLIIFLGVGLVFLLSGIGATGGGEDVAEENGNGEEESGNGGEGNGEEGGGDDASSGDVDAEGVARDNCASCHGEDFTGGMGPALEGTDLAEEEFTSIVREGQGQMPSFDENEVADEELTAMYEFFSGGE